VHPECSRVIAFHAWRCFLVSITFKRCIFRGKVVGLDKYVEKKERSRSMSYLFSGTSKKKTKLNNKKHRWKEIKSRN
jgi:hypothetical protein